MVPAAHDVMHTSEGEQEQGGALTSVKRSAHKTPSTRSMGNGCACECARCSTRGVEAFASCPARAKDGRGRAARPGSRWSSADLRQSSQTLCSSL